MCRDLIEISAHLRGGCDAKRVVAAANHLGDQALAQHADVAGLHSGHFRALPLAALPLRIAPPGDDLLPC